MESTNKHKNIQKLVEEIYHQWGWGKDGKFIEDIKTKTDGDFAIGLHHTTGRDIRNSYGFWTKDTDLYEYMRSIGLKDADDMSHKVLLELHKYATEQLCIQKG